MVVVGQRVEEVGVVKRRGDLLPPVLQVPPGVRAASSPTNITTADTATATPMTLTVSPSAQDDCGHPSRPSMPPRCHQAAGHTILRPDMALSTGKAISKASTAAEGPVSPPCVEDVCKLLSTSLLDVLDLSEKASRPDRYSPLSSLRGNPAGQVTQVTAPAHGLSSVEGA